MIRILALIAAVTAATPALALIAANTTANLNLRAAPSTSARVIATMPHGAAVTIDSCIAADNWCQVQFAGLTGYASGQYLSTMVRGEPVIIVQEPSVLDQVLVQSFDSVGQAATGLVGAVGGAFSAAADGVANAFNPAPNTVVFLNNAPTTSTATIPGGAVVGARVPNNVALTIVPNASYMYTYVNGRKVLVDPQTREIVYVVP